MYRAVFLLAATPRAVAITCGELKEHYKTSQCCGMPDKDIDTPGCPYNFDKPACDDAEPQAPRDLTDKGQSDAGSMVPKQATLTGSQAAQLPLVNVHFHIGAEHKANEYSDDSASVAYDSGGRRLATDPRPGYKCTTPPASVTQYTFQYCKDVVAGETYEVHYVHSSAGYSSADLEGAADIDAVSDGLGGAANGRGILNPMIVVQGVVFQIGDAGTGVIDSGDLWDFWASNVNPTADAVMYAGSTTGQSHDNEVCSPYHITWHTSVKCYTVTPQVFDNMCKHMIESYNMEVDLYPHGSRKLVDTTYVVSKEYVFPYEE